MKNVAIVLLLAFGASSLAAGHPETEKVVNLAKKEAGEITAKALKAKLDNEEEVIVLDVREAEQRAEGEIFANEFYSVTRGNLEFKIPGLIKNKEAVIVTYCRGGSRGALAAQSLKGMGYKNAVNLQGGLKAWAEEGYPIETGLGTVRLGGEE